jgi:O-glycosyl hydrolase
MKPIKLRAWDWNKMLYPCKEYGVFWRENNMCVILQPDWKLIDIMFERMEEKKWELMQYTWLKDKNWKEVYEWDIMKWTSTEWSEEIFVIEWDDKNAKFIDKCICHWYIGDMNTSDIETVWNIYENPELLSK